MITKAIVTAAGYGTRFLPATKNVPKELLPVLNKPTIHYIVENLVEAGIKDIIIVTRFGNHSIEDYFDTTPALENYLVQKGKVEEAERIKKIYRMANFIFIRQNPNLPYGNASPLYSAKELIGNEPFIYAWGDDIILGEGAGTKEIISAFNKTPADVYLTALEVPEKEYSKLGMIQYNKETQDVLYFVEKPKTEESPSNLATVAPYILTPKIFNYLKPENVQQGKEFIFQEAFNPMIADGHKIKSIITSGKWLTTGDPLNYLKATFEIAMSRPDLKEDLKTYLKERFMSD